MDTVYIETSIVSHATARPSSDIQIAAIQQQARDWWSTERPKFELVTSQLVIDTELQAHCKRSRVAAHLSPVG